MRRSAPLLVTLLLLGCARAPRSEPAAHTPAEHADAAEESSDDRDAAGATLAPPAAEPAPAGAKKVKAGQDADAEAQQQPAERASETEKPASALAEHERLLADALAPSALSCAGAEPHVKSICAIAERICQSARSHPGTMAARDCQGAESSCEKAKRDYAARCE